MTHARRWVALHRRCPPRSPPPLLPPPRLRAPLCTGRPTCVATPFASPLRRAHGLPRPLSPFPLPRPAPPRPPLCAHAGGAGGTVCHPPPFRSRAAVPSAQVAPCPACTSSTPFAHMLGAGRTERPPSLSVHEKAPPPGLLPLPRLMRHPP